MDKVIGNVIDFTLWNELLRQYVDEKGQVNYFAWKQEQPTILADWLLSIAQPDINIIHPSTNISEKLAFWINLYNAFTITTILEYYPIKSILPRILGIPNWLGFLSFFQRRIYLIGGKYYSLSGIENKILREQLQDSRIHFAIVCASIGCPLLRNTAYFPQLVQQQLDDDTRRFINNPEKVSYDEKSNILYCSKIFKWYRSDFLKTAPSIPEYIRYYLDKDLAINPSTSVKYLDYDWNLNQRISS
ncbi:DUF547 domain-containing protein [Brunnivagina elsteri]|uniref:DUF547 domain-containing protein n=1 Tax=Brunnivagina elsteri CCALA 953 TaxID=987040 RepID=A0A2A2TPI8_9CYAN|nr:DUF547 domain-containing protein [Calothrix elsteri]PAX60421.1 hypothetical protein CK510_01995 [Calothrix elsteri CCALA 953]